jgi:STE24 endopeptidase
MGRWAAGLGLVLLLTAGGLWAAESGAATPPPAKAPITTWVPEAAKAPASSFDVKAATDAYLAEIPPARRASSDAYFEGGYWLMLWDFLYGAAVMLLLLATGLSARMRDWAERFTRFKPLQTFLYFLQFILVVALLQFPLTVYEGFFREHQYGLATQTFGPWMGDLGKGLLVSVILGGLLVMLLVGIVRRLGSSWWVWGAVATVAFFAFVSIIGPVFIAPLFNRYQKLEDPKIRESILSMARANGIPASEVYEVDASRQTTRISANVSGFMGTERITLNDNLLRRCTPAEIQTVMGHEMGHYVLNHGYKLLTYLGILIVLGFAWLNWSLNKSLARWGAAWKLRGFTDVAAFPLAVLLFSVFGFVTTPVANTIIRVHEFEADLYGLNAAREPDAEAQVDLMLGEYRKLDPGPVEEFLFFDHPSGRTRITAAMRWKKEHLAELAPAAPPAAPAAPTSH